MANFLEQFLQGGTRESEGEFTISPLKSLEKLGRHSFARSTDWAVKLLEAGSAEKGVSQIRFVHKRSGWSVTFEGMSGSASEILDSVFNPQHGLADPMLGALRFLFVQQPETLALVSIAGGRVELGLCQGGEVQLSRLTLPGQPDLVELQFTPTGQEGSSKEVERALVEAAGWMELPVLFNGKRLEGQRLKGVTCSHVSGRGRLDTHRLASAFGEYKRSAGGLKLFQEGTIGDVEAACAVGKGPGKLVVYWLSHGVILKSKAADLEGVSYTVHLLLPFDTSNADLTGFDFSPSEVSRAELDRCTGLVANLAREGPGPSRALIGAGKAASATLKVGRKSGLFQVVLGVAGFFNWGLVFIALITLLVGCAEGSRLGLREFLRWAAYAAVWMVPTFLIAWARSALIDSSARGPAPAAVSVAATPLSSLLDL